MAISGIAVEDLARGFDAIEMRHGDVHHHDGGLLLGGDLDGFAPVGGFAHHFKIFVALQQQAQAGAHHRMIVGEQNAYHAGRCCFIVSSLMWHLTGQRKLHRDGRSGTGPGFHAKRAAQMMDALFHAHQAQSADAARRRSRARRLRR